MELIPHDQFAQLRLRDFVAHSDDIVDLEDWEYEEQIWVGEAIGFSEWLRLEDQPDILGSLALDFTDLPDSVCQAVLNALHLDLQRGMSCESVFNVLGQPRQTFSFVPNRKTYEFKCGKSWPYTLSCTIQEDNGLTYLTVMATK